MSHITTTTSPVPLLCTSALIVTMIVMTAPTYVGLAPAQNDVVLPPPLTSVDVVRDIVGFIVLPHPQLHSQMHIVSQLYANYAISPLQMSSFRIEPPINILC